MRLLCHIQPQTFAQRCERACQAKARIGVRFATCVSFVLWFAVVDMELGHEIRHAESIQVN